MSNFRFRSLFFALMLCSGTALTFTVHATSLESQDMFLLTDISIVPPTGVTAAEMALKGKLINTAPYSTQTLHPYIEYSNPGIQNAQGATPTYRYTTTEVTSIQLSPGQVYAFETFLYIPRFLSGEVAISYGVADASGNPVFSKPITTLERSVSDAYYELSSCRYGDEPLQSATPFMLFARTTPNTIHCEVVGNVPLEQTALLSVTVYESGTQGKKIANQTQPITFSPTSPTESTPQKSIEINLPDNLALFSGKHVVELLLISTDTTPLTPPTFFKIETPGTFATINELGIDKNTYASNDTARIDFRVSIRPGIPEKLQEFSFDINVIDKTGALCAPVQNIAYDSKLQGKQTLDLKMTQVCHEPRVALSVLNEQKKAFLHATTSTTPWDKNLDTTTKEKHRPFLKVLGFGVLLILLCGSIIGIILWRRHRTKRDLPPTFPSNF